MDDISWELFETKWRRYKKLGSLPENAPDELRDCLEKEIRAVLLAAHGVNLETQDEETVLENLKSLVVREKNKLVLVIKLMKMT